ncbi:MAG: hypothetical protein ABSB76_14540 [Streptosporangiaceae bacterium]|jgi:hypothetical protein
MHNLGDLATITHDEKLRDAARDHLHGTPRAARHTGNWGTTARRLADLRVLRGRRAAQTY